MQGWMFLRKLLAVAFNLSVPNSLWNMMRYNLNPKLVSGMTSKPINSQSFPPKSLCFSSLLSWLCLPARDSELGVNSSEGGVLMPYLCQWHPRERRTVLCGAYLWLSHSVVSDFVIPWTATRQASLSFTISQSLLKLRSIESLMPSHHLILCHLLLLLPSIFPSIRVISTESAFHIRWPVYWTSFSFRPSNEYSGLISFRMHWLDLLVVQGTLKSLLQHHNLKASIPQHSAFFMGQLSHPYKTTGKTIALTIQTFVGKVMSLFFNTLPRFVIAFFQGPGVFEFCGCSHRL